MSHWEFAPPLASAALLRRYKRFLADVRCADGSEMTIHCPNTGSMKNCADPGDTVWYSTSDNAKRKYPHTWELSQTAGGDFIGINTHRANGLVGMAIESGVIDSLKGYAQVRAEVRYGEENSRIDWHLSGHASQQDCFVEVKSVTLREVHGDKQIGYFPDAVSTRGQKHLRELMMVVRDGQRGVLLFCVQHTGIDEVRPALHIDPAYSALLAEAMSAGVEVYAWRASISPTRIALQDQVPVSLVELSL